MLLFYLWEVFPLNIKIIRGACSADSFLFSLFSLLSNIFTSEFSRILWETADLIALNAEDFPAIGFSAIDFIELNEKLFRKDLFEETTVFCEEFSSTLSSKLKVLLLVWDSPTKNYRYLLHPTSSQFSFSVYHYKSRRCVQARLEKSRFDYLTRFQALKLWGFERELVKS